MTEKVNAEFTVNCKCGHKVELYKETKEGEESTYTDDEGWYLVASNMSLDLNQTHDVVYLNCSKCGNEGWIFT